MSSPITGNFTVEPETLRAIVRPLVEQAMTENTAQALIAATDIGTKVAATRAEIQSSIDVLREKVSKFRKEIDDELEKLRDKIIKKANWYFVPIAILILLAGVIGIYSLLGTTVSQLRKEATEYIIEVNTLKSGLKAKKEELDVLAKEIGAAKAQLEQIKSDASVATLTGRINDANSELSKQQIRIDKLERARGLTYSSPKVPGLTKPVP